MVHDHQIWGGSSFGDYGGNESIRTALDKHLESAGATEQESCRNLGNNGAGRGGRGRRVYFGMLGRSGSASSIYGFFGNKTDTGSRKICHYCHNDIFIGGREKTHTGKEDYKTTTSNTSLNDYGCSHRTLLHDYMALNQS